MSVPHRPVHTQLAYRVLFRPSSTHDFESCLEDLVEEVLAGAIPADARDVDGTPLLTLMMSSWDPPSWERKKEYPFHQAPLPGRELELSEEALGPRWQWPALVGIWKGFSPFENWPEDNVGWLSSKDRPVACPALAAVRHQAWTVLELCLRHPDCPPASRWDVLSVANGEPLLHRVVNYPKALEALLAHGLNPDRPNELGRTALFYAETPHAVSALLSAGANPHHADREGNNAPTHWGESLRIPKVLLDAWKEHASAVASNGRMVVSALRSDSWKTVTTSIAASGWDPLSPVDPSISSERLLPAASRILMETYRAAGSALPITPLLKLLSIPRYANAWTVEEKAWARASLLLVQSLSQIGSAFSSHSMSQVEEALRELSSDSRVTNKTALVMPSLLSSMAKVKDDYREESVWRAWLNCLPLVSEVSHEEQGWETLSLLVTHPPARLESLIKEKLGLLTGVFEKAHRHGAMDAASEKTLLGLLILRSRSSTNSSTLEAADHAWRRAWNALPGPPRFPSEEPWVGKMLSKIDTPQMLAWKEWFLTSNLSEPSVSRKGPRL